jgi:hypothetical protein
VEPRACVGSASAAGGVLMLGRRRRSSRVTDPIAPASAGFTTPHRRFSRAPTIPTPCPCPAARTSLKASSEKPVSTRIALSTVVPTVEFCPAGDCEEGFERVLGQCVRVLKQPPDCRPGVLAASRGVTPPRWPYTANHNVVIKSTFLSK